MSGQTKVITHRFIAGRLLRQRLLASTKGDYWFWKEAKIVEIASSCDLMIYLRTVGGGKDRHACSSASHMCYNTV